MGEGKGDKIGIFKGEGKGEEERKREEVRIGEKIRLGKLEEKERKGGEKNKIFTIDDIGKISVNYIFVTLTNFFNK